MIMSPLLLQYAATLMTIKGFSYINGTIWSFCYWINFLLSFVHIAMALLDPTRANRFVLQ